MREVVELINEPESSCNQTGSVGQTRSTVQEPAVPRSVASEPSVHYPYRSHLPHSGGSQAGPSRRSRAFRPCSPLPMEGQCTSRYVCMLR